MQQPGQINPAPQHRHITQSAPAAPTTPPVVPEKPVENSAQQPPPRASVEIDTSPRTLGLAALILVGIFALKRRMRVKEPVQNLQQNLPVAQPLTAPRPGVLTGEYKFSESRSAFKGELAQPLAASQVPQGLPSKALQQYYEVAPERLDSIKNSFSRLSHAPAESVRQQILTDLASQVRSFRTLCDTAQLGGILQLAAAVEGLITQMADTPSNVTPTTLRTAASAILLLENLAKPGHSLNLPVRPQFRFLAVDDDVLSRKAVSLALKKVSEPDLAENGDAALALLEKNPYDVIFLDIEMPGMDGFQLCARIRQSQLNRTTPVIFVTSHCDFDSRAKSTQYGGQDLIGKPFLPFELAVKALILAIRAPLKSVHTSRNLTPALQPSKTVSPDDSEPTAQFGEIVCQQ
jgi:CheY-like chemotaxis protein